MKLVRENLNFERGKEPIKSMGARQEYVKKQILKDFEKMGININIDFEPANPPKILENIYEIKEYVDKLLALGVKSEDIEISHPDSIQVNGFSVKDSNLVLIHCLTEEDANIIAKTLEKFMINGDHINIDRSSMSPYIHFHKENEWLKNLEENRKKYGKIS